MRLIVFAGLPGTGKSSVAETIGRQLNVPVFAKDWLEATLRRCRLQPDANPTTAGLGYAGYELLTTLAERQMLLGQSVILDSVASTESIRQQWRQMAAQYGAVWIVIECVCSDEELHQRRLTNRRRGIPGWDELEWSEVQRVKGYYAPWQEERLILDAVNSIGGNIAMAARYIHDQGRTSGKP
jgi:predicted kinase